MKINYFTEDEARYHVGSRIEAISDFPSVPAGTQGTVVKARKLGIADWVVRVEWDLPRRRSQYYAMFGEFSLNFSTRGESVTDEFSKDDFARLVRLVEPVEA